jgi:hypothetical protein
VVWNLIAVRLQVQVGYRRRNRGRKFFGEGLPTFEVMFPKLFGREYTLKIESEKQATFDQKLFRSKVTSFLF